MLGAFQIVAVGLQLLFSTGHDLHHEPQSAQRIFTASLSDLPIAIGSASFVIVVTLHYKLLANQVLCLPIFNILSRQFECTHRVSIC